MRLEAAAKCRESHMVRRGWRSDGVTRARLSRLSCPLQLVVEDGADHSEVCSDLVLSLSL